MTVTYYFDDFQTSYYEALNAQSNAVYTFALAQSQPLFVQLDFYPQRMYPYNCRTGTSGTLSLFQNGRQIDTTQAKDELGFAYIYQDLKPGTYQI